ncbi:hypothetical protein ISF_03043 [Cordyceps fumosorosea ARSEF 2679]|uniref:Uncharacterized protein n=1 Tax=Cordyceps fumosorosea (strain ARSEF 2679) TaxID=1081104 RepID=A0A168B8M9_CORFA|nr:hypothetical protein ISF_03043 [Cordyceps fumosorosea ARSEF 2679]OAA69773.1 hypothetical protein ISF_03043 [Cordyceps fumosorosea ARSEF 2679]
MYTIRPRPVRSHNHAELLQTEQFFQNGSLAWRYDDDDADNNDAHDGYDSDTAPAHMDIGHFRWFWPWGVRRSSTFDTMPSGKQRLPVAALLPPSSASTSTQPSSLLLTRLPPELRLKIWRLVLRTRCSTRWPYHPRSPAWRPDRRGAPYIDVALLRTCRAVYAEAWDLPMRLTFAALADGTPSDKPSEWAPVVLAAGVLVPHAWQVLLLRRAEVTMQHFRLEAGFLEMWVAALGKLKAAAAACVADLVAAARARGQALDEGVVARLGGGQPLEEIVVRLNRKDWWTWTSVPPPPWPDGLPGKCVADVRAVGRRGRRKRRRRRSSVEEERQREAERESWARRKDVDGGEDASSELETDEDEDEGEDELQQADEESRQNVPILEETTTLSETSYDQVDDPPPQTYDTDDPDDDDEQGGYFSDHTASSAASSAVYVFDAATLPASLALVPLRTETWDRPAPGGGGGAYGVLSPNLRLTLMLETFGPKSLQLDAALAEARAWRLPMPLVHAGAVRAGAAVEDRTGRVLAWDGRPVREYHWLRDVGDEEAEEATFLRMGEFRATAEGVVVKMMTLVPRSF